MTTFKTTALSGVGDLNVMKTASGRCVGVIRHRHADRRELVFYHSDPDTIGISLILTREEADGLAELLKPGMIANHIARLEQHAHGVVTLQVLLGKQVSWPPVGAVSGGSGQDAAIVAVVRDTKVLANPSPELRLQAEDVVVVVGAMAAAVALLETITTD